MKEKIGIEDLVGYLNRYHSFPGFQYCYDGIDKRIYIQKNYPGFETQEEWVENERIISKRFGFIKWLVENDKIDLVKVYENLTNYEIEIRIRAVKELLENNEEDTIAYLKLLMLLAIQDEPIRFLCEILK